MGTRRPFEAMKTSEFFQKLFFATGLIAGLVATWKFHWPWWVAVLLAVTALAVSILASILIARRTR